MIEDMMVRKFAEKTRNDYIRHVKNGLGAARRNYFALWAGPVQLFQFFPD